VADGDHSTRRFSTATWAAASPHSTAFGWP
jgi:hypothetical protein